MWLIIIGSCIWLIYGSFAPLNKILLFITIYIAGAYYLILLDQYFLALSYVIVYIGAIAILFIFIIMICNTTEDTSVDTVDIGFIFPIFIVFFTGTKSDIFQINDINNMSLNTMLDIQNLSLIVFDWYITILLIGLLLTSCIIGILDKVSR